MDEHFQGNNAVIPILAGIANLVADQEGMGLEPQAQKLEAPSEGAGNTRVIFAGGGMYGCVATELLGSQPKDVSNAFARR